MAEGGHDPTYPKAEGIYKDFQFLLVPTHLRTEQDKTKLLHFFTSLFLDPIFSNPFISVADIWFFLGRKGIPVKLLSQGVKEAIVKACLQFRVHGRPPTAVQNAPPVQWPYDNQCEGIKNAEYGEEFLTRVFEDVIPYSGSLESAHRRILDMGYPLGFEEAIFDIIRTGVESSLAAAQTVKEIAEEAFCNVYDALKEEGQIVDSDSDTEQAQLPVEPTDPYAGLSKGAIRRKKYKLRQQQIAAGLIPKPEEPFPQRTSKKPRKKDLIQYVNAPVNTCELPAEEVFDPQAVQVIDPLAAQRVDPQAVQLIDPQAVQVIDPQAVQVIDPQAVVPISPVKRPRPRPSPKRSPVQQKQFDPLVLAKIHDMDISASREAGSSSSPPQSPCSSRTVACPASPRSPARRQKSPCRQDLVCAIRQQNAVENENETFWRNQLEGEWNQENEEAAEEASRELVIARAIHEDETEKLEQEAKARVDDYIKERWEASSRNPETLPAGTVVMEDDEDETGVVQEISENPYLAREPPSGIFSHLGFLFKNSTERDEVEDYMHKVFLARFLMDIEPVGKKLYTVAKELGARGVPFNLLCSEVRGEIVLACNNLLDEQREGINFIRTYCNLAKRIWPFDKSNSAYLKFPNRRAFISFMVHNVTQYCTSVEEAHRLLIENKINFYLPADYFRVIRDMMGGMWVPEPRDY